MYEHVTCFIDDIERGVPGSELEGALIKALYHPEIVDKDYRETLDWYRLEGDRLWSANIESLDLKSTLALLTFVHRADYFNGGGLLGKQIDNGFVYRILLRLRELDGGPERPSVVPFWSEKDWLGCLSNWHPAAFEFGGTRFATAEHWMMWQKARVMGDREMAEAALNAPHPRDAKIAGGKVAPYDGALWEAVREQLVYYGVREKYLQNERERNLLLSTGCAVLVEASPYDRVWGVGLAADDPAFGNVEKWRGSNLQGRVSMRVRADLRCGAVAAFTGDDAVRELLDSPVGGMTLLELSRVPATRGAVVTYARVARHLAGAPGSVDEFLAGLRFSLREVDAAARLGDRAAGGVMTEVAWRETVAELALAWKLGRL